MVYEACATEPAELEEQQEPLAVKEEPGPRQGLTLRKSVLVAAGVLLLGAAALALYARPSAALFAADAATPETADFIQAYTLGKTGRTLSQEELTKVQRYIDSAKLPHIIGKATPRGALKARWLKDDQPDLDDLPDACKEAMKEMAKKIMGAAIKSALEAMGACMADAESDECKEKQAAMEKLEEDMNADCKSSGDLCTMKEGEGGEAEEQEVCMPKACHAQVDLAAKWADAEMGHEEHDDDCKNCTRSFTCGEDD